MEHRNQESGGGGKIGVETLREPWEWRECIRVAARNARAANFARAAGDLAAAQRADLAVYGYLACGAIDFLGRLLAADEPTNIDRGRPAGGER